PDQRPFIKIFFIYTLILCAAFNHSVNAAPSDTTENGIPSTEQTLLLLKDLIPSFEAQAQSQVFKIIGKEPGLCSQKTGGLIAISKPHSSGRHYGVTRIYESY
ncbi:MAG: hypothetical protein AB1540_13455, partial [Bdellovibrionota bacterium]